MTERFKTISQISEMLNLDRRTLKKRLSRLELKDKKGRGEFFDMVEVFQELNPNSSDLNSEIKRHELVLIKAKSEKALIELDKQKGSLIETSEVAKCVEQEYTAVRTRLLSIPSRCAKDLSLEFNPALVKERLDLEVREALEELTADKI